MYSFNQARKQDGFYSYKDANVDVKTHYIVEYTTSQEVLDLMDTADFDFSMLSKREFDYLEDAVCLWNRLFYREDVLHVMLFEQVLLNGEIVLEQMKTMSAPSVLDKISEDRVKNAEYAMKAYQEENEMLLAYLAKYGITKEKVRQEMNV